MHFFLKSIESLFFPPFCTYCQTLLEISERFLCNTCLLQLELIDPYQRCGRCFAEKEVCHPVCTWHKESLIAKRGAAFVYEGVPAFLVHMLKEQKAIYLAKSLSSYLFLQWERLSFPIPDIVIPTPLSFRKMWERGFNQSELLAEAFAAFLHVPCERALLRHSVGMAQTKRLWKERKHIEKGSFVWDTSISVESKRCLLIDDVMVTGATLESMAEALAEGFPKSIFALTVAIHPKILDCVG